MVFKAFNFILLGVWLKQFERLPTENVETTQNICLLYTIESVVIAFKLNLKGRRVCAVQSRLKS